MNRTNYIQQINGESVSRLFLKIYGADNIQKQRARYIDAVEAFYKNFNLCDEIKIYSASGRTEIGGNHTDHQRGKVLAGAVSLDNVGVVAFNNSGVVRVMSKGYPPVLINVDDLTKNDCDTGTCAIVKGVIAKFKEQGVKVGGFDMYCTSDVVGGGGISSSAAFETLVATVINEQYNGGKCTAFEIAKVGHFAENVYFGKKCGLLDQSVCAYGGLVCIDFCDQNEPRVEKLDFDFEKCGYTIFLTDTKSSHENLTDDYVAIREEMGGVAKYFGCDVLSEVDEGEFYSKLPALRNVCSDRAILRAMHFFGETKRAYDEAEALKNGNIDLFLKLVNESGISSGNLLQNLYSNGAPTEQAIPLAIAISKKVLKDSGAVRVHGGGFAGTIQAFVPTDKLNEYKTAMENVFGSGSCIEIKIREFGGIEIK